MAGHRVESGYFTIFQTYFLHCTHVLYFLNSPSNPWYFSPQGWKQFFCIETGNPHGSPLSARRCSWNCTHRVYSESRTTLVESTSHPIRSAQNSSQHHCKTNMCLYDQPMKLQADWIYRLLWFWRNAKASDWISRDPPWNVNSSTCWVMLGSVIGLMEYPAQNYLMRYLHMANTRLSIIYYSTHWINCSIFM